MFLLGLGKLRKMCVIEATNVFFENVWRKRRMDGDRNPQPVDIVA